jgi:hypothetical protein
MHDYETVRLQVTERIAAMRVERDQERLVQLLGHPAAVGVPIWRRPAAGAGLALIRLGAWLRGERWLPATGAPGLTRSSRSPG